MRVRLSTPTLLLFGVGVVFFVAGVTLALLARVEATTGASRPGSQMSDEPRDGRQKQFWMNGHLRSDVTYRNGVYEGEYRTYYESGAAYELRHYRQGHENGVQQSWTETGVLYLNYEVRDGRRFGLVNPTPCNTVGDAPSNSSQRQATRNAAAVSLQRHERGGEDSRSSRDVTTWHDVSGLPFYGEPTFTPRWTPVQHQIAPFEFDTQTGGTVSAQQLRGRPYVASFIYTQCAAVCPILVRQLSRVALVFSASEAHIVSFSVTPETDTPEALARFARDRGIDSGKWSLATGRKHDIYGLARGSFFAEDERIGNGPDDETAFLHTEKLLLVDGEGHLRGVYNGTQPHAVDQLIGDLRKLTARSGQ